jgi:homoserine kinase
MRRAPHFSFAIPASTSNLGAGFDALSLALNRYLRVAVLDSDDFVIDARGVSSDLIPLNAENLILRVAYHVAAERAWTLPPFRLSIDNEIPLGRGLGSSAAAILAGITCYELVTQDRLSDADIFRYAFEFEPHPDNLAASLYGSLVSAATTSTGETLVAKLAIVPGVVPILVIPDFTLSTEKARAVLPSSYSMADTIYNIQRSALTIAALTTGKWSMLREAMRDRIHQPYRISLVPGLEEILTLDRPGLLGVALSGAGPSVLAFADAPSAKRIGEDIAAVFRKHGVQATPERMDIDTKGRTISKQS